VNFLMVTRFSVRLEFFLSMIAVRGYSCNFCILLGGFQSSRMLIGGLTCRNGVWRKFWLGRLMISGSSMNVC
jgi:hypothetical protein